MTMCLAFFLPIHAIHGQYLCLVSMLGHVGLRSLHSLAWSHVLIWGNQMSLLMHVGETNFSFEILYEEHNILSLSFQLDVH